MLKNYELLYILHPDLEGSSEKIAEKVTGFITKVGGEITNQEDWGKRKLAYPIAKNDFGVYVLVYFTLESGNLPEIEHDLRLSEEIMRSMIVQLPEVNETKRAPRAKKAARTEEKVEAKATKAPKAEKVAAAAEEKVDEAPVAEEAKEKPKKAAPKKAKAEVAEESKEAAKVSDEEKPKAKKTTKKAEKPEAAEKERLKKLDEKLEEILGE